jgi:hypothetical protein
MIKSQEGLVPVIDRSKGKEKEEKKHVHINKSSTFIQHDTFKALVDPGIAGLSKHMKSFNLRNFGPVSLPSIQSVEGKIKEEESDGDAKSRTNAAMANNSYFGESVGNDKKDAAASHTEDYNESSRSALYRDNKGKKGAEKEIDEMSIHNPKHPSRWRDLDKLISLLQTQTEDDGYFIYLRPGDNGDPYDLHPLIESVRGSP